MSIEDNYIKIQKNIIEKSLGKTDLLIVTKNIKYNEILKLINLGHKNFGESLVQEAQKKWLCKKNIKLHMIGHLQTNKVREALNIFNVIESLDSEKLANKIKKELDNIDKNPSFLIQINIANEKQKYGIHYNSAQEFIDYCLLDLQLKINGIMCIPPKNENPKPYFKKMKKIADDNNLSTISMGMSNDFEKAIECGSTQVRIGSKIFNI